MHDTFMKSPALKQPQSILLEITQLSFSRNVRLSLPHPSTRIKFWLHFQEVGHSFRKWVSHRPSPQSSNNGITLSGVFIKGNLVMASLGRRKLWPKEKIYKTWSDPLLPKHYWPWPDMEYFLYGILTTLLVVQEVGHPPESRPHLRSESPLYAGPKYPCPKYSRSTYRVADPFFSGSAYGDVFYWVNILRAHLCLLPRLLLLLVFGNIYFRRDDDILATWFGL